MNTILVTRYEIRAFTGSEYSKPLSAKLRNRSRATRLVKRLTSRGVMAFASPMRLYQFLATANRSTQ